MSKTHHKTLALYYYVKTHTVTKFNFMGKGDIFILLRLKQNKGLRIIGLNKCFLNRFKCLSKHYLGYLVLPTFQRGNPKPAYKIFTENKQLAVRRKCVLKNIFRERLIRDFKRIIIGQKIHWKKFFDEQF